MTGRLEGKVALITGAASGIGLATAERFVREGAAVVLTDIQAGPAELEAARLRDQGHRALAVTTDVTRSSDVRRAVEAARSHFGRLDVLFANAGVGYSGTLLDAGDEDWDPVMDVNAKGVFFSAREAIRQMLAQDPTGGSVVINGSISGLAGIAGQGPYAMSKGAVVQMTRQLAVEYATRGIRVNCVCPGTVDTPVLRRGMAMSGDPDGFLAMLVSGHPIGRIGRAEEIASAVAFLASDDASFITGAILPVDGGYTAR
jgi:NAD(P)-dependent dehydrogenase (short-subunit alcohol dehydrogenase family)